MKVFVFDAAKCNGCRNCQLSCKDEHCGADWSPYAKPQPDTGHFWYKIEESIRGQVPKVIMSYVGRFCQHCENAPCAEACSHNAFDRREDGLLILNPEKCNGCLDCIEACPYGVIYSNENLGIAQKCTGCAHLLDDGWEVPRCVDVCPHEALRFGNKEDFAEEIARAEALIEGINTEPHVYYLNLPKRFVGGIVVDLEADEVVVDAKITLENLDSGEVQNTKSDEFGDFWFRQIDAASYKIYVESEGYLTRVLETSTVDEDKNVGPIDLFKIQA